MALKGNLFFAVFLFFSVGLSACRNEQKKEISGDVLSERMVQVNKILVQKESKQIDEFIAGKKWTMNSTGSGLRYEIYKNGNGNIPIPGNRVAVVYQIFKFDGTLCNAEDDKMPNALNLGVNEGIRGLEEGIMLMHEGDKARLVIPAHLAYGMRGDGEKIPGNCPLYVDVSFLKIIQSH